MGAGPAGIATALEVADAGFDVLLVESGRNRYDAQIQALGDAADWDRTLHAPMSMATRRQVGGASTIWGGRCVAYDPVDFDRRPWVTEHRWPAAYDELTPYFRRACDWLMCGRAVFDAAQTALLPPSIVPGLPSGTVRTSDLERWSLPTQFGREYADRLRRSPRLTLVTGVTCTEVVMRQDGSEVDHLVCRTLDRKQIDVRARRYVIACGGLESTRLLLASHGRDGHALGDHAGHLGRWYMGHLEGVIANVRFTTPPRETIYDYERDIDGVYVRRRISFSRDFQHEEELPNITSWLVHPELADPQHGSGVLSMAYLALSSPLGRLFAPDALRLGMTGERVPGTPYEGVEKGPVSAHLKNLVRDASSALGFVLGFGARRFLARGRKVPGFSVYNRENLYPLQYHGEHRPHGDSRVTLAEDRDALGMQRLRIDMRFDEADVDGVVRAHRHWDAYLRLHDAGRLEYLAEDVADAVRSRLGGGFHQTGTTRMSARPEDGVLDSNLAVHGIPTLHVASSSAFPTSSQANSTFMVVVFALRLADHVKRSLA